MTQLTNKMKVLAVDDNRTNLHILQVFLKKLGHEVLLAENGEEAVRRFEADSPDLVVLDIMMPIMDGFEAARRIKAMNRDRWVPVIFLSALNRDENLVEGLDAGADDYLTKPINFVVLEAKLRSVQRSLGMQQAAIDSLRRVQAISDNVLDAIVTIDEIGTIATVNPATQRIFGYTAEEMLGQNVKMLMPEPYHSEHDGYLANYKGGGKPKVVGQEREVSARKKDGTIIPVMLGVTKVELDNKTMFIGVVRDISAQKHAETTLRENAEQLQIYYNQTQNEQQLAMKLMEMQLHRQGLTDPRLHYKVLPAENFSGDIVAAARSPEGRFYVLLADATGHGLTAAISVLPVLAIFYRLARNNHALKEIILELNHQLKESMPIGRFVAATVVCIDEIALTGEIWVGGTPQAFLLDRHGHAEKTFESFGLPLGIVDNNSIDSTPIEFIWTRESQLVLYSDGLIEANNLAGEQFGVEGLLKAAAHSAPVERFALIDAALSDHLQGTTAADDVSLMIIDCP
jgi:PAS domain S-box-containing protein